MPKKLPKLDLTLLKKLVAELETSANHAQELPTGDTDQVHAFIIELAKTSGLAANVAQEASALVKDTMRLSALAQQPAMPAGGDLFAELFGGDSLIEDPDKKNRN